MYKRILIANARRTPFGRFRGGLSGASPQSLAATASNAAMDGLNATCVTQLILGNVLSGGHGMNLARQVALSCGLAEESTATTINMMCGSGLQAAVLAAQAIQCGAASAVLAGGVESMSQSSLLISRPGRGQQPELTSLRDSMQTDGLRDCHINQHMGDTAERLAREFGISRGEQDAWAVRSQVLCERALKAGRFRDELCPVGPALHDEHPRPEATLTDLSGLAPVFDPSGTVTAGNSSGINDGAAMLVMADEDTVRKNNWPVLCEWVQGVSVGCDPLRMGLGPVYAIRRLLECTGKTLADLDCLEINEAFAVQTLACLRALGLNTPAGTEPADTVLSGDHALKLNPDGGAIAIGHPLGASGARLLTHAAWRIRNGQSQRAVVALCIGGGMGIAAMVQAWSAR
jgi:acetyl-CoA C-acetyltransferase